MNHNTFGRRRTLALLGCTLGWCVSALAQSVSIKTNLLYDATLTPNIGAEVALGRHSSVQAFYGLHPWKFSDGKSLRHWSVMPEYRYWLNETFRGTFFGVHALGGEYNAAGVKLPFGILPSLEHSRYEGRFVGGGLTFGHAWSLGRHWALEAAIGVGYARYKYTQYENVTCGRELDRGNKNYFGPTKLALNLAYLIGGKETVQPAPVPQPVAAEPYVPQFRLAFFQPQAEAVKARSYSGSAFLDFPVNQTVIQRDYRGNSQELDKVIQTISVVREDPNTEISNITIHGYASPEGSYAANSRLAAGRATALKDYVRMLINLPDSLFSVDSTPEDWQGLRRAVEASSLPHAADILDVIDLDLDPDPKEARIRASWPADYRTMLADIYPSLRHSDYTVSYSVRAFSTDEAREIIKTKPQQLSLNEMFLVAQSYPTGSEEYNSVFQTAVRLYPADETANLNAAIIALNKDRLTDAAHYLERAGQSAQAVNARGVLAAKQGHKLEAARLFEQAATDEARHNLNELTK